jgi:hypothetical protein
VTVSTRVSRVACLLIAPLTSFPLGGRRQGGGGSLISLNVCFFQLHCFYQHFFPP